MPNKVQYLLSALLFIVGAMYISAPPPPGKIGKYMDGVFPTTPPGEGNLWELEEAFPDFTLPVPVRMIPSKDEKSLHVICKSGQLYEISYFTKQKKLILDIEDRVFNLGDGGAVGFAFHPNFGLNSNPEHQVVFIYYRTKPNLSEWSDAGFNRLSKFYWNVTSESFDASSEEILIQQYDRGVWHNGGPMFFGKDDGFLYVSFGDEGLEGLEESSTQKIDAGFFSGMIRIDVDNDPLKSHPIKRQPEPLAAPAEGWWETYSTGYSIPNDNVWVTNDSSVLEEFVVVGMRSPFSVTQDNITGEFWLADVGSDVREELSKFSIGDNLQWPYKEGFQISEEYSKPEDFIGKEKEAYFEYERSLGTCIIGGEVYHHNLFPELNGKYIYGDFTKPKVMALTNNGTNQEPTNEILLSNLEASNVPLPDKLRLVGISVQPDGNIFVAIFGEDQNENTKIMKLKRKAFVPDPPSKLSELGVFTDLESLSVRDGIIPFDVNSPLWSDGAVKRRWMAVPNNPSTGIYDEKVKFNREDEWKFPEGSVFIKHFDLPLTLDGNGELVKLETRFFIIGELGRGYGLTYKWNEDGTEAFLLGGGDTKAFDIYEDGEYVFTQNWDFPSRDQCMSCHNSTAGYVLGLKTHQLNCEYKYDFLDDNMNQLDYLNEIDIFDQTLQPPGSYLKSYTIDSDNAGLDTKIRSYLDANCASCHQRGGIPEVNLDFRYNLSQNLKNYINIPSLSHASTQGGVIIKPGEHESSEMWIRDASDRSDKMPPIGSNILDQEYIDSLALWIDNLDTTSIVNHDLLVFPNPSDGWIAIRLADAWEGETKINIYTVEGRIIRSFTTESKFFQIDLTSFPSGNYILYATADERRQSRRFVLL